MYSKNGLYFCRKETLFLDGMFFFRIPQSERNHSKTKNYDMAGHVESCGRVILPQVHASFFLRVRVGVRVRVGGWVGSTPVFSPPLLRAFWPVKLYNVAVVSRPNPRKTSSKAL